jgi:hypothetical protein
MTLRRAAALALTVVLVGCPKPPPYNPFHASRDEVRAAARTVALIAQVNVPTDEPAKVLDSFEGLITAKLAAAGFVVVPRKVMNELWERTADRMGGLYDPKTGKADEDKRKAIREHVLHEVSASHHADSLLYFVIGGATARFEAGDAYWHGVHQAVSTPGFWSAVAASNRSGQTNACSLYVSLEDLNGRDLYTNAGGIELLTKLQNGQFVTVPRAEVLVVTANHARAVDIALDPLAAPASPSR